MAESRRMWWHRSASLARFELVLWAIVGGMYDRLAFRPLENMRDVLMDPNATGPDVHYWMIRGGSERGNVTVWETGVVEGPLRTQRGGEYIKTYGHYHVDRLPETYQVLAGEGIAVLQKRKEAHDPSRLAEVRIVRLAKGDTLDIPEGYGHMVANVGPGFLITLDDSPVEGSRDSASMPLHADYEPVRAMKGFAYHVVENSGSPALVKNPLYQAIGKEDLDGLPVIH